MLKMLRRIILVMLLIPILGSIANAQPAKVWKTGQTTSYYTGDDGDIEAGVAWPSPRYIVSGDCVTDNLTGMMWTKNANLPGTSKTWQQALDYASNLTLCGYSDWRLPNRKELMSLIDRSKYGGPTLPFINVQGSYYWSSTHARYTGEAWIVYMWSGFMGEFNKSNNYYVWPVRSGQVGHLVHSIIGSVTENGTGLGSVTMTLSGDASATTTTAGDGTYSFAGLPDGNYSVTPSLTNYTFTPVSRSVTVEGSDVIGQDFYAAILDSDNDGMTNTWETAHGLNPNDPTDATQDPDQDGLTNLREFQLNSNPNNKDSDGDGLPDGWEVSYNLDLTDNGSTDPNNGASGDPDGDGVNNLTEYQYNQNPQEVNLIQIEINPSTATPISIGGRRTYEVVVRNARLIPDTVSISVTGIDPSWYSLSDTSLMLLAGEERRITLNLHLPEECSIVTSAYDIRVRATPQTGLQVSAGSTLLVYSNPIITDITPGTDETLASNQMAIHWMTDASGTTEVFYRSESETAFTSVTGASGTDHQVTLDGLVWNSSYDWYVRTQTTCGVSQSATRSAFISAGIIFENAPYEFFIERDYEQPAYITVRNIDSKPHNLLLQILNPAQDLIAGFRGDGSVDQVISLVAGERKTVEVAFHAQDAKDPQYALQFKIVTDPESSRPIASYAPVTVHVRQPVFRLQITQVSQDPQTLTATYRITNTGDPVTDLMVTSDDTSRPHIMMQPTINHGELRSGGSVDIVMMADQELSGQLLLKSAIGEVSHPVSFGCGTGKSLFQVPVEPQTLCLNIRDTYCQNKPKFILNFKTPSGLTQDNIAMAGFFANFYAKNSNYGLKPYDTYFYLNEKPMMTLLRQVPTGEKGGLFPPDYLNYALNGTAQNAIRVDTRQFNGGHYRVNSDFTIALETEALKVPVCASTQEEALTLAQPRITPLSCNKDLTLLPVCPTVSSVRTLDPVTGNVKTRFQPGDQIRVEVVLYNPSLVATGTSLIARFDDNVQDAVPPVEVGESVAFTGAGIHTFHIDYTPTQEPDSGELWIEVEATDNASCQDRTGYATFVQVINDRDGDKLRDSIDPCPDVVDCDGDGLTDYEEVCYDGDCRAYDPYDPDTNPGGTDTNVQDNDSDGDGYDDRRENQRGSNPLDPSSYPAVTISGHVYGDRNGNGSYDAGEGIRLATVTLTPDPSCGILQNNPSRLTAIDGFYEIANLPACIYQLAASWKPSTPTEKSEYEETPLTYFDRFSPYISTLITVNVETDITRDINISKNLRVKVVFAKTVPGDPPSWNANYYRNNIIPEVIKFHQENSFGLIRLEFIEYLDNEGKWFDVSPIGNTGNEATWQDLTLEALSMAFGVEPGLDVSLDADIIALVTYTGTKRYNPFCVPKWPYRIEGLVFLNFINNENQIPILSPDEYQGDFIGAWAHEFAHAIGIPIRGVMAPHDHNIKDWDVLAQTAIVSERIRIYMPYIPTYLSTWEREWLGWAHYEKVGFTEGLWIESIDTNSVGGVAYRFDLPAYGVEDNYYILEARVRGGRNYNNAYDKDPRMFGKEIYSLNLYNVIATKDTTGTWSNPVLNIPQECIYNTCINDGILDWDGEEFRDHANRIKFRRLSLADNPPTSLKIKTEISPLSTTDYVDRLKGIFLNTLKLPQTNGNAGLPIEEVFPDLDLHVYTSDGKHVGMNYDTGIYEVGIPGALASGDMLGSIEWILLPLDLTGYHYVVSTRDVQEYLKVHPEITPEIAVSDYEVYSTVIDPASPTFFDSDHVVNAIVPGDYLEHGLDVIANGDGTYSVRANSGFDITNTDPDSDGYLSSQEISVGANPYYSYSYPGTIALRLNPGFNLVNLPIQAAGLPTAYSLLTYLGDASEIDRILYYDSNMGIFREVTYDISGNLMGSDFQIDSGITLIVYSKVVKTVTFKSVYCYTWDMRNGINLVGSGCSSSDLTALQLLERLGGETVASSIQRYNTNSGQFDTAAYENGRTVGVDFAISPGEGYFVFMKSAVAGFRP